MKIKQDYIESFMDLNGKIIFKGCHVFSKRGRYLLLGENGNIILLNCNLYQKISDKEPGDDLWFKLLQRGLAVHRERNVAVCMTEMQICPTYFMIDMTSRCNMRCRYCMRDSRDSLEENDIDSNMIIKICRYISNFCKRNEIRKVYIQPWGGEPLLQKEKIFLIQEEMKKHQIETEITIETNGLLLSEELVKELHSRKIGYGISIDGFEDIHDRQRTLADGTGTHKRVEQAVKYTQKYFGRDTSVLTTATKQSIPCLGKIIEYFARELTLKNIKINFVHKSVFQQEKGFCVDKEEIELGVRQIFEKIVSLNEQDIDIMEYNLWVKMMNILTNRKMDACISRGCSGGRSMIAFDTKGNIFPCDVTDFPEEKIGSVFDERDLEEIIEDALKEKSYFVKKNSAKCKSCPWQHFCRGGCTVHVKCAGGKAGSIDEIECTANQIVYPKIVELILDKPELVNKMLGYDIL